MPPPSSSDRIFPHSGGSEPRPLLRPPRLPVILRFDPVAGVEFGPGLRAWAARRAAPAVGLPAGGRAAKPS